MEDKDKKKIIERYEGRIKEFGPVQKSLGWLKGRQRFRFLYLKQIERFVNNDSVLDVGCGYGDLKDFLLREKWNGKYTGVDIVPKLIEIAREKYQDIDARVTDILMDKFEEKYDWVFSSGALTSITEAEDTYVYFEKMLTKMFSLCNKGVSVNFCSPYVEFQSDVNFHPDITKLLQIVTKLTKRFSLRHDYMPYEFTIYLYKDADINKDVNIFSSETTIYETYKINE